MSIDGLSRASGQPLPAEGAGQGIAGGVAGEGGAAAIQKMFRQVMADAARMVGEAGVKRAGDAPGSANAGAPALAEPTGGMSAEEMTLILGSLQSKLNESQLKTAKESVQQNQQKQADAHADAMKKLGEAAEKLKEAAAVRKANWIIGIVSKVFTFVAAAVATALAVAATVATSGAAAPLLAVAVAGLVMSGIDLAVFAANEISQKLGGPEISFANMFGKLLEACGVPEDKAKEVGSYIAMGVQVVAAVAMVVASIAAAIATAGAATPMLLATITSVVSVVSSVVQGGMAAAQGGLGIAAASHERDASRAQAGKAEIDKILVKLQAQMEQEQDRIKDLVQKLEEGFQRINSMISSAGETRMQIARNMV